MWGVATSNWQNLIAGLSSTEPFVLGSLDPAQLAGPAWQEETPGWPRWYRLPSLKVTQLAGVPTSTRA